MKLIYLFLMLQAVISLDFLRAKTEEDLRLEANQVTMWQKNLDDAKALDVEKRIPSLWLGLRNIGYRRSGEGHSEDVESLYLKIQKEMLAMPNHAQYFVDELERERAALKPGNLRNDYNSHRWQYVAETLIHLPSPQTIRVLGDYLSDERDVPVYSTPVSGDWVPSPPQLASKAIMEIGLRNPPITEEDFWKAEHPEENALALTKSWYDEVKTGRRGFSFVGQTVEYRFKEDGTVESTALPASILEQDAIWTARPKLPARYPGRRANSQHISGEINSWIWIGGGLLVGVAGICWFRWKRTTRPV